MRVKHTSHGALIFAARWFAPLMMRRVVVDGGALRARHAAPRACAAPATANSFRELGLSPLLLPALSAAGIEQPTDVQRVAFTAVLSGGDAVLLSETGSGKTLAYALPILHRLLDRGAKIEEAAEIEEAQDEAAVERPRRLRGQADQVIVLVPNRDLCAQVLSVFAGLLASLPADERRRLSASSLVSETDADTDATILISTPAVALNIGLGPERLRTVVLDEADALLAGSFKPAARSTYPIEQLIALVKRSAKEEALSSGAEGGGGWKGGPRGRHGAEARAARHRVYASKQFLLVGATMPNAGTRNIEEHVKRLFPLARWHRAAQVHRNKHEISHYFIKVDAAQRGEALRQAVRHGPAGRVLVFANTLQTAKEAFEEVVGEVGPDEAALFHAELAVPQRGLLLQRFGEGSIADEPIVGDGRLRVLVCTGLAARGLDFVGVAHVVQFDVATNAVEFIHRVGRTARAGRSGVSTTLYTEDRSDLVEGLRDALTAGEEVEHLFSRKRSFKLGIKKRARRAQEEEEEEEEGEPRGGARAGARAWRRDD